MGNTDKIVKYLLDNGDKLSGVKIQGFAEVIRALGGEVSREPNSIPIKNEDALLEDSEPLDLSNIQGINIDGIERPVRIYGS